MTSPWNLQINRGDILLHKKMESENYLRQWRNQLPHSTCDFFHPSWELVLWWIFAGELFALLALFMCPDRLQIWCHSRMCFAFCQESAAGTLFWWQSTLLCLLTASASANYSCEKNSFSKYAVSLVFRQWSSHRLSVIAPPWLSPLRTQKS